jgi:probable rRNA maturation factor
MIEVVNRQRRRLIDTERWSKFAEAALGKLGKEREGAIVAFVSDRRMRELNLEFRGLNRTTDVLSFPNEREQFEGSFDGGIGDVVISVEQAARQAAEHGLDFETEVAQLIVHGLLHLCGYDHETDKGEMNRLELRLRRQLGI